MVGARPNFVKIAPIIATFRQYPEITWSLVHTGQHYDNRLSGSFFHELEIPPADVNLAVGSGSNARQTAEAMARLAPVLEADRPDVVLVVGDVNSTVAAALVAAKMGIRVAHVEAGLRSFDRSMPEEINRVLTDRISDWLFVTEPSGVENLRNEGVDASRIHFVGNVMIDTLLHHRHRAMERPLLTDLGLQPRGYALCTLHRPCNVDTPEAAANTIAEVREIAARITTVVPLHPRSKGRLEEFGLFD